MLQNNNKTHLYNKSGFTLVEVMVAVAVLLIVALPLLELFVKGAEQEKTTGAEIAALQAAQNLLESNKAAGLDKLLEQQTEGMLPSEALPGEFSSGEQHYLYSLQLERSANHENNNNDIVLENGADLQQQYLLTVLVWYETIQGRQEVSLSTLLQRRWNYQKPTA